MEDITKRAYELHVYYKDLIINFCPEKYYDTAFEFLIKDDKSINARSRCTNTIDYIELNIGVVELYFEYFTKVMRNDRIKCLKSLGVKGDDEVLATTSYEGVSFKEGKLNVFDSKIIDAQKTDLLDIFVSRFILLHEFGHIFNGHCKFVSEKLELNAMSMYFDDQDGNYSEEKALILRTLEMDADAFAATQSIRHIFFLYKNFEEQVTVQIEKEDLFYWWAFAIKSHFMTCEDITSDYYYKTMTVSPQT